MSDDASVQRTRFVWYQFFKQPIGRFGRKPIIADGARSYIDACSWLELQHYVYGTDIKNKMERFVQKTNDRTECFDDNFPYGKMDCSWQHIYNWLKMCVLYLHQGMNRMRFMKFILDDGGQVNRAKLIANRFYVIIFFRARSVCSSDFL